MGKRVRRTLCAALVVLPVLGAAQSASAQAVDLMCPFAATFTASPGVSLAPGPQTFAGDLAVGTSVSPATPCSSILTGVPYTGGTVEVSGTGTLGCVNVGLGGLASASLAGTVTWNNGDTSTVTAELTAAPGPVFLLTIKVPGGALQGSTVVGVPLPTGFTGNCLLTPATGISAVGVAAFLRI